MFEKIKKFFTKFNKKENNQEIQKKNKNKLSTICGFAVLFLLSTFLIQQFGIFELFFNQSSSTINPSSSSSINSTTSSQQPQTIKLEEGFIIEDFIFEDLVMKKNEFSLLYKGLENIEESLLDFVNTYNEYSLKLLEEVEFSLVAGKYIYNDSNHQYIYDTQYNRIVINNSSVIYDNVNGNVSVTLYGKEKYSVDLEGTRLSFVISNAQREYIEYVFELNNDDWTITYLDENNIEYCEHYRLDNCSLIEVETTNNNYLYHIFVYEEIKNETRLEKSEEDGSYLIYEKDSVEPQETFNFNESLMIQNYYISDAIEVYMNHEVKSIIGFVIWDSYLNGMGMPFGLGK